jgi:hypothetical protein
MKNYCIDVDFKNSHIKRIKANNVKEAKEKMIKYLLKIAEKKSSWIWDIEVDK